MKLKYRKFTSMILILAIMFSMVPAFGFTALAEEEQDDTSVEIIDETVPEEADTPAEPVQDDEETCDSEISIPVYNAGNSEPVDDWRAIDALIRDTEDGGSVSMTLVSDINLRSDDLMMTIDGNKTVIINLNNWTIQCEDAEIGMFYNKSGSTLTIMNGTLENATSNFGGAINNHGTLNLVNVEFNHCIANYKGGAIMNYGTLTMTGGSITECGAGAGGAIYNMPHDTDALARQATVTLDNVTISGTGTLGTNNETGDGGAIAVKNGKLTMIDCTIKDARVYSEAGNGGAIFFDADGKTMSLTGTKIENNASGNLGGGICISAGNAELTDCSVTGNFCPNDGDGIYIGSGAEVTFSGSTTVKSNMISVISDGMGIYQGGTLNLRGKPVIEGNGSMNLYLPGTKIINVIGTLESGSKVYITADEAPRTITSGFTASGNTDATAFVGDENYDLALSGNEIYLTSQLTVFYIERSWDETTKTVVSTEKHLNDYELLHSTNSSWYTIGKDKKETWYVAQGDITMKGTTLTVRGDVHIILCNGASLRVLDGIEVKTDQSLTIHSQAGDTGYLYAKNNESDAGIGCGPNTGVGNITIQGGIVEAHGGKYAAGIGSGEERQMGSVITILGGDIRAYGGDYGAGIGSGDETGGDNGSIIIYGGTVEANGGYQAAGIGGGNEGNGRHITIWGGNIKAYSGKEGQAAGIGGGDDGGGGFITINGGDVYAESKLEGPGIGGDTNCGTIIINGGKVTAVSKVGSGIGGAAGENLVKGSITINGGDVTAYSEGIARGTDDESEGSTGIGSGFYDYGGGDLKVPITINGGTVIATGSGGSAGIGSAAGGHVYGQITINGGLVIAKSEDITDIDNPGNGAGIGSGARLSNEGGDVKTKIIINGGTVIATAGEDYGCVLRAQAIGRGFDKDRSSAGCQIYDNAKVTSGDRDSSAELQLADNRVSGVRRAYAKIEPCNHPNACYTKIDEDTHRKTCIYCGLDQVEPHSGIDCVCGHHDLTREISFSSLEGVNSYSVIENAVLYLPFFEGQIITDGNSFMRVTGWEDQETSVVHKPGSPITIDKDMSFAAVGDKVYRVRFDDTQLGYMSAEQSDGDLIGAAKGETVRFTVTPVDGYRVSKVSYTVCEGEYPLIGFDPVEIIPADDTYQLTMPDLQSVDLLANTVLISAEFEAIPSYTITCETCANGTVSTGEVTTAYAGDSVRVYVEADDGYSVSSVSVNGTPIVPVDGKYFFEMPACDVTVSAEFCFGDGIGASLAGYSLSLDGDIGVNFYMELSDEVIAHKDTAYMKFTIPSGTSAYEADVLVKDAVTIDVDGKTYYVFKCNVSAKDMNSEIKAQIIDGDKAGTEYSYTVQTYAQYILDNTDVAVYAAAAPLVKAMLNYGAYSQIYFGINTDNLANNILTEQEQILPANVNIVHDDVSVADLPSGVTFEGYSVMLRSEVVLSLFFKNKSGEDVKFYYNGSEIEPVDNSGYLRVKITGITAGELSSDFTVNAGSGSVTCSPMNYCKTILEGNYDDDLKNVVKALYVYSQAADEYLD